MSAQTVLFDAPGPRARQRNLILTIVGAALIVAILALVAMKMGEKGQLDPALWSPFGDPSLWVDYLVPGLINTLKATAISVVAAGVFGVLFGAGRLSENALVRRFCGVVVEVFRAIPVLIMMIFVYSVLNQGGWLSSDTNSLLGVVIALTLYNGSVIAELVRSGVHALPKGQHEGGLSLGLTPDQTLRLIQLPQALVAMLPALIGQLVVVLKDSALGSAITYMELLNWAKTAGSSFANAVPMYMVAALLFIVMNYSITKLAGFVERRLRRTRHTAGPVTTAAPNIVHGASEPGDSAANEYEHLTHSGIYDPDHNPHDPDLRPGYDDPYKGNIQAPGGRPGWHDPNASGL